MDLKKRKVEQENGASPDSLPSEDDIAQLVELLSKEQLATIVRQAALSHSDILSEVRELADEDPAARKLFVRGLSWTTGSEVLKRTFEKYGPVEEAVVITDKSTGKSKGFGFVTFKHRDASIRALKEPSKKIEGRMTVCHLSGAPRESYGPAATVAVPLPPQVSSESVSYRKIYVGNVPKTMQGGALLEFFSQYGEIEEGPLGFDKKTGKCKGFALFIYKSSESVRKCLEEPLKKINGHQVQCKIAESQKGKDEGVTLTSSSLGYDLTNPAVIASYNPSFMQTSTQGLGQYLIPPAGLSSYGLHGIDPLSSRGSSMLVPDSAYATSSLASLYGLPASSHSSLLQASRVHPSLASIQNAQASGYPPLPRSSFY